MWYGCCNSDRDKALGGSADLGVGMVVGVNELERGRKQQQEQQQQIFEWDLVLQLSLPSPEVTGSTCLDGFSAIIKVTEKSAYHQHNAQYRTKPTPG